jgi:aspartate kinase
MNISVLKFGGSTFGDEKSVAKNLPQVAAIINQSLNDQQQVVVVVSALAGETRAFKNLCHEIGITANSLEQDAVLAIGEEKTAGLLQGYLNQVAQIPSITLMRDLLPIHTDSNFGNANITNIDNEVIKLHLQTGKVVIIPGFIGKNSNHQTTTLGLDGSDTTAVAVAAALKAQYCKLYKDVLGVFTSNPRRVSKATKLDEIASREMYVLSALGTRIIHPEAIKIAIEQDLCLKILPNFILDNGTTISQHSKKHAIAGVSYLQEETDFITISVVGNAINSATHTQEIIDLLAQNYILAKPQVTIFPENSATVSIRWQEQLTPALEILHRFYKLDADTATPQTAFIGNGKQKIFDPSIM